MFRGILLLCLALVGVVLVAGQQSPQEAQMIEKCFQPCNVPPEERNDISTQWLYKNTPSNICKLEEGIFIVILNPILTFGRSLEVHLHSLWILLEWCDGYAESGRTVEIGRIH